MYTAERTRFVAERHPDAAPEPGQLRQPRAPAPGRKQNRISADGNIHLPYEATGAAPVQEQDHHHPAGDRPPPT